MLLGKIDMCNRKIKIMNGDVLKTFECIKDRKIMNGVKIEMHKHDGSSVLHSIQHPPLTS